MTDDLSRITVSRAKGNVFEVTSDGRGIKLSGWKAMAAALALVALGLWVAAAAVVGSVAIVRWMTP